MASCGGRGELLSLTCILEASRICGEDYHSRVGGFPKPGEAIRGGGPVGKRGCADVRKICSLGETVVLRGCVEYLFPGRDCIDCRVARMRGRPVPRERLYTLYCISY